MKTFQFDLALALSQLWPEPGSADFGQILSIAFSFPPTKSCADETNSGRREEIPILVSCSRTKSTGIANRVKVRFRCGRSVDRRCVRSRFDPAFICSSTFSSLILTRFCEIIGQLRRPIQDCRKEKSFKMQLICRMCVRVCCVTFSLTHWTSAELLRDSRLQPSRAQFFRQESVFRGFVADPVQR